MQEIEKGKAKNGSVNADNSGVINQVKSTDFRAILDFPNGKSVLIECLSLLFKRKLNDNINGAATEAFKEVMAEIKDEKLKDSIRLNYSNESEIKFILNYLQSQYLSYSFYLIEDIDWDMKIKNEDIPTNVLVPILKENIENKFDLNNKINDYLSDTYGYLMWNYILNKEENCSIQY